MGSGERDGKRESFNGAAEGNRRGLTENGDGLPSGRSTRL
jgi:hypothetical protein